MLLAIHQDRGESRGGHMCVLRSVMTTRQSSLRCLLKGLGFNINGVSARRIPGRARGSPC